MMRVLLVALCSTLTAYSSMTACSPIFEKSNCSDKLVRATTSADGQLVASLIRRDCGATTAYSNIVYLKKSGDAKGKDGGGGAWGEKIYVLRGEMQIAFEWHGTELKIKAPTSGQDVFLKRDDWESVKIVYE